MPQGLATQRDQLEDAFQMFNQVSGQLVDSYQVLQSQVTRLSEELTASRGEQMRELAEKTRLANRITRLLETLPAAVVVLDGDAVIQQYNPAAKDLLPEISIGEYWMPLIESALAAEQSGEELWLRNGRLVSLTNRSLSPEPGSIHLLLDVTETRALQARIERQNRLSNMGEMAAQLAHQIRTPLSSALLYNAHLAKSDLSEQQRTRFSERCADRLRHIESQITDMLSFARGGQFEIQPVVVDDLLEEFRQMAAPYCSKGDIQLEIQRNYPQGCTLQGNRAALVGAFLNLLINALENGGKVIHVRAIENPKEILELSITDDGPGISAALLPSIFEPFFTTRSDGTGLGLAVVREVIHAHHGEISVKSPVGEGASFVIQLPMNMSLLTPENLSLNSDSKTVEVMRNLV